VLIPKAFSLEPFLSFWAQAIEIYSVYAYVSIKVIFYKNLDTDEGFGRNCIPSLSLFSHLIPQFQSGNNNQAKIWFR